MRPRETPHTSTPIAGAQTSQAHKLSQDLEPPASRSLSSWPAAQCRGLPSCPPRGWLWDASSPCVVVGTPLSRLAPCGSCGSLLWPPLPARCRLTPC